MKLSKVDCSRGAPMGRREVIPEILPKMLKLRLQHMPLDSGGYDSGGAYWGLRFPTPFLRSDGVTIKIPPRLYKYWNDEHSVVGFIEAHGREQAKLAIQETIPCARFFR